MYFPLDRSYFAWDADRSMFGPKLATEEMFPDFAFFLLFGCFSATEGPILFSFPCTDATVPMGHVGLRGILWWGESHRSLLKGALMLESGIRLGPQRPSKNNLYKYWKNKLTKYCLSVPEGSLNGERWQTAAHPEDVPITCLEVVSSMGKVDHNSFVCRCEVDTQHICSSFISLRTGHTFSTAILLVRHSFMWPSVQFPNLTTYCSFSPLSLQEMNKTKQKWRQTTQPISKISTLQTWNKSKLQSGFIFLVWFACSCLCHFNILPWRYCKRETNKNGI